MKVRLAPHFRKFENKKRLIFKIVRVSAHHKLLTPNYVTTGFAARRRAHNVRPYGASQFLIANS